MSTETVEKELTIETMTEIATLATSITSIKPPTVEDMNKQVRRIAEHAQVTVGVIYDQVYQHVQHRDSHPSLRGGEAYQALVRFRRK